MGQTTLLAAIQAVVGGIEIAHQGAGKRLPQGPFQDRPTAVPIDQKEGQAWVGKTPDPGELTVDLPTGLIGTHDRGIPQQAEQFLDDRFAQGGTPTEVAQDPRAAHGQAKEVTEERGRFPQRDAQKGAPITTQ
jgi:hypothetical protein